MVYPMSHHSYYTHWLLAYYYVICRIYSFTIQTAKALGGLEKPSTLNIIFIRNQSD